ncbi:MAG: nitrous oxide-stimulated promoter family protein [Halarcobacter sp.]
MQIIKFKEETQTLKKFFELYCEDKHSPKEKITKILTYKNENIPIDLNLCPECLEKIKYSFDRLLDCPHEIKPRCRTCPNPCYEKKQWKEVAKVMRYSGTKLGLSLVKKKIKNLFK